MKKLSKFLKFDLDAFLSGKVLQVVSCREWLDYETKEKKGTRVEVAIMRDKTDYGDAGITNLFEKFSIKIPRTINVPAGAIVEPIDGKGTVYGDFRNQLSVTASDLRVVQNNAQGRA